MGETREQRVIRQVVGKPTTQKFTPIATDMFLPNHSGIASHPEAKKTFLTITDAETTYVPYTGASANVVLGTRSLTTTGKLFAGNMMIGGADTASNFHILQNKTGTSDLTFGGVTLNSRSVGMILEADASTNPSARPGVYMFQKRTDGSGMAFPLFRVYTTNSSYSDTRGASFNAFDTGAAFYYLYFGVKGKQAFDDHVMRIGEDGVWVSPPVGFTEPIDPFSVSNILYVKSSGNVGIGTNAPVAKVDITQPAGSYSIIAGSDISSETRTNATRKFLRVGMPHYTTSEEPAVILTADSDGTDNLVNFGGGTSSGNAATNLRFYTAANATTVTGTERMRVTSNGDVAIIADSKKLLFGAGQDASIDYDGTKGNIRTDLVTPSDLNVDCGTDKTIVLEETVWDDFPPNPIIGAKLGSTAPTLATFVSDVEQYTFDATNDYVIGSTEIPHNWKEGTTIYPHVHWATNGTNATDRGVQWQLKWTVGDATEVFSAQVTSVVDTTIPLATADRTHFISEFDTTMDGTNLKIGAVICWRLERIATAHANGAPANDPFALSIGFHGEMDTVGSRQKFIK